MAYEIINKLKDISIRLSKIKYKEKQKGKGKKSIQELWENFKAVTDLHVTEISKKWKWKKYLRSNGK